MCIYIKVSVCVVLCSCCARYEQLMPCESNCSNYKNNLAPLERIHTTINSRAPLVWKSQIMTEVTAEEIQNLLQYFWKNTYKAKDADETSRGIMQKCLLLTDLDYDFNVISNAGGEFSAHYPSHLMILENNKDHYDKCDTQLSSLQSLDDMSMDKHEYDVTKLKELMRNARYARCRSRFPLPVILCRGKHICRSATLSGGAEIYGRTGLDYFFFGTSDSATTSEQQNVPTSMEETEEEEEEEEKVEEKESSSSDWQLFDKFRRQDIKLLKTLSVGIIIDLMVEKKKVKFGMNVTSSEKVDSQNRYNDFTIVSLPYPGCEFFKKFRGNDYVPEDMFFNWSQSFIDAELEIPSDQISDQLQAIGWNEYQQWDVVLLTKNYLRLIIRYLRDSELGILVHCISGWDRTPLFISLLRMSLWADRVIHVSLNAHQMLYYTIAYDWMLFGHNLQDRLHKEEEIFFFCFHFLKYIVSKKYSIHTHHGRSTYSGNSVNSNKSKPSLLDISDFEVINEEEIKRVRTFESGNAAQDLPKSQTVDKPSQTESTADHSLKPQTVDKPSQTENGANVSLKSPTVDKPSQTESGANISPKPQTDDKPSQTENGANASLKSPTVDKPSQTENRAKALLKSPTVDKLSQTENKAKALLKSPTVDKPSQTENKAKALLKSPTADTPSQTENKANVSLKSPTFDKSSQTENGVNISLKSPTVDKPSQTESAAYNSPKLQMVDKPSQMESTTNNSPKLQTVDKPSQTEKETNVSSKSQTVDKPSPYSSSSPLKIPSRNGAKATSPIAVPKQERTRNDSTSSAGSWQFVTETGSIQSNTSYKPLNTSFDPDESYEVVRKERLNALRSLFYTVYSTTIGIRMKDNSDVSAFGQVIENIAGLISTQRTSS